MELIVLNYLHYFDCLSFDSRTVVQYFQN